MNTISRTFLALGAAALLLATGLGAYGTHALAGRVSVPLYGAFSTAVDYQFYHGLGLLAVAALLEARPRTWLFSLAGWLLVAGIVLFCGSIYATTFGAPTAIGSAAPIGGTALMAAWLTLALGALRAGHRGPTDSLT
jgi:uncharacterized membrane protein YgdD (TMEM256/DUF423 family)